MATGLGCKEVLFLSQGLDLSEQVVPLGMEFRRFLLDLQQQKNRILFKFVQKNYVNFATVYKHPCVKGWYIPVKALLQWRGFLLKAGPDHRPCLWWLKLGGTAGESRGRAPIYRGHLNSPPVAENAIAF